MYQVNTTRIAEQDLLNTAIYIAQILSNQVAANRLLDKAATASVSLSQNPMRQPLVKDGYLAAKGLRSLPVNNYLLFYVVRQKTNSVNIIRFIHSSRDWSNLFGEAVFENTTTE